MKNICIGKGVICVKPASVEQPEGLPALHFKRDLKTTGIDPDNRELYRQPQRLAGFLEESEKDTANS